MLRMLAYFGGNILLTLVVLADATPLVGFGWAAPVALCALVAGALLSLPLLLWWPAGAVGWLIVAVIYLAAVRPRMRRRRLGAHGGAASSEGVEGFSPPDIEPPH